jgi:hypothetical protein
VDDLRKKSMKKKLSIEAGIKSGQLKKARINPERERTPTSKDVGKPAVEEQKRQLTPRGV